MGNVLRRIGFGGRRGVQAEPHQQAHPANLRPGVANDMGGRPHMEDFALWSVAGGPQFLRGFFVVCDGHGGQDAAKFTSENLLRYTLVDENLRRDLGVALRASFLRADSEFRKEAAAGRLSPSGTTALVAVVLGRRMVLASAGDCRAILSRNGVASELTNDHKPDSPTERRRIEAAGGFVDCDGYLNGDLAVSRAIGDHHLPHLKCLDGSGPLIADPEVCEVPLGDAEEFLVLTSDGVWMRRQTVVDLVRDSLRKFNCPTKASQAVVEAAVKSDAHKDNVTVVVVCLKPDPPAPKPRIRNSNSRLRINRDSLQ
ncbi:hypothetical protein BSKO_11293 [Bryopsis sp. KO-2023]|nr:hypothetical protein BSKO_11293 [Bryopsis sp. KO-2023]